MKPVRSVISTIALALLCACGSSAGPAPASRPAAATPVILAESPPPAEPARTSPPPCTGAGPASADWPAAPSMPGRAAITAAVAGDTLTLGFERGTPAFEVRPQPSTRFSRDPSGVPVTLDGAAGVAIVLRGFRGDTRNYAGPQVLTSGGPVLREVREIGDSEGVVTWAAGLAGPGCASVGISGSALAIRFVPAPAAAPAPTPTAVADMEAVARQVYRGEYPAGCPMND